MRRLNITIEADSLIQIDEEKWTKFLRDHPATEKANSVKKQEKAIEGLLASEINRDELAVLLGAEGGYDKHHETHIHVFLQEYCQKHEHWFDLDARNSECDRCVSERAAEKLRKKEERERAAS